MIDLVELLLILASSLVTGGVVLGLPRLLAPQKAGATALPEEAQTLFHFQNGYFQDATAAARDLMTGSGTIASWNDLCDLLEESFPGFPSAPGYGEQGEMHLKERAGGQARALDITWKGADCWVSLLSPEERGQTLTESRTLQEVEALAHLPTPAWALDADDTVLWANPAYQELQRDAGLEGDEPLFPKSDGSKIWRAKAGEAGPTFQITTSQASGFTLCYGANIDAQLRAEEARLTFMQTLAKTFAHLPTGLAIFDRDGRLALFNPALVDLTRLSGAFLSAQPSMTTFLDRLRDTRSLPEPKDYPRWRNALIDSAQTARDGGYHDTWPLEDGRTFRVQARPQPDGATAILIEDVTAEVMMTRSFRRELEMGQTLLDIIEDAVAVFSRSGVLTFTNAVYRDLWGQDPETSFADVTIADCIALWRDRSGERHDWDGVEHFVRAFEEPEEADMPLPHGPARQLEMRTLSPGVRMIRFRMARTLPTAEPVSS